VDVVVVAVVAELLPTLKALGDLPAAEPRAAPGEICASDVVELRSAVGELREGLLPLLLPPPLDTRLSAPLASILMGEDLDDDRGGDLFSRWRAGPLPILDGLLR
jgi:hypothetical protein